MRDKRFFDTNVLIYAFASGDPRSETAEKLLSDGGVIGVQVLNEFVSVTKRKLGWTWEQIEDALSIIDELLAPALPLNKAIHANAVILARDHSLSFFDALIVAAALDAGCHLLISEDMQHGRRFGPLIIHNPFGEN